MLSLVSTTGAVEVHSLGDTTVSRFSLDKVVAKRTQLSRAAFLCLGKVQAMEIVLYYHRRSSSFRRFSIKGLPTRKCSDRELTSFVLMNCMDPRKNRASSELLYKSNRPQVSMGYRLINHLGCWWNTRRIRKSLACGSWFTNSCRVFYQNPAWFISL